jgi:hypothetical protein
LKITFISGPLIPQKCGITDHINTLCLELCSLGHEVEKFEFEEFIDQFHRSINGHFSDFYSIQFAPYAFSVTGYCGAKLSKLGNLLKKRVTHVNFHEIWIGDYKKAPILEKLYGWKQKKDIHSFMRILNPRLITCTNSASLYRLKKSGIPAKYLYLFGNFPVNQKSSELNHNIQKNKTERLKVAVFGTLYEKFPYSELGKKLADISMQFKKQIQINIIGLQRDKNGLNKLKKIAEDFSFIFEESGKLSSSSISRLISRCHLGVSSTPYDVLGKSSATAAMLEHGLPILCYDDKDTPKNELFIFERFKNHVFMIDDHESDNHKILKIINSPQKNCFNGVSYTANRLLELMS